MKVNVAIITLLLVSCYSITCNSNNFPDHGKDGRIPSARFKAKVILLDGKLVTGYFVKIADDSVHLFDRRANDITRIPVVDIQTIKLRRKGAIWKGTVIGVVTGLTAGIVLTSASLKDDSDVRGEENDGFAYVIGAVVGYAYGGLGGMFIGMHQKKFNINGHLQIRD
ncbi:hypothetical protein KK083_08005 [Fulvivirgaceae bacterium PWU4]|uniref:Uncharacterized protein n=1 Tax=Chryseosolibacter histidini TaxID=2782349 RepID=A0AAP2DI60_9BACT|nr:hypothetical protein [Chryseosolibacter histidini]MBT1696811.1 hypothetical protein [Chryseosolibacter histidini]